MIKRPVNFAVAVFAALVGVVALYIHSPLGAVFEFALAALNLWLAF